MTHVPLFKPHVLSASGAAELAGLIRTGLDEMTCPRDMLPKLNDLLALLDAGVDIYVSSEPKGMLLTPRSESW